MRLSPAIVKQMSDVYRKIRNTFRYLLGNLYDFDPARDSVAYEDMEEFDRWALLRLEQIRSEVSKAYEDYQFHVMYHAIHNFCTVDLSAIYLDVLKDRLYTERADSRLRRSAQTAMFQILTTLVRLIAPVLSFTAEEVWQHLPNRDERKESVLLSDWPEAQPRYVDEALEERWNKRLALRSEVMKVLEESRQAKEIGHSLDADITIYANDDAYGTLKDMGAELADFYIVSTVTLVHGLDQAPEQAKLTEEEDMKIVASASTREKCERCWKHDPSVGSMAEEPHLCARCASVLKDRQ